MQKISSLIGGFLLIAIAIPAFAQVQPHIALEQKNKLICIQKAVEKREIAFIQSFSEYSTSTNSALTVRMNELKSAWSIEDKKLRQSAINEAWNKYNKNIKSIHKEYTNDKKDIWDLYKKDHKNCTNPTDNN